MKVSVVLLAYREEENLRVLLPKLLKILKGCTEEYEIIVVDTQQPLDHTEDVCRQFGARYVNQKNKGFGDAFRTGIAEARYSYFLIMDSDGSHDPRYIPKMVRAMQPGVDLVIGSRYVKNGKTNDAPVSILMSKCLNFVFRLALGIRAHDISTDFRLYRTGQLKRVRLQCENYDVLQEVLLMLRMQKPDFRIAEIPITFRKRLYGESKRALIPFMISYLRTLISLVLLRITCGKRKGNRK